MNLKLILPLIVVILTTSCGLGKDFTGSKRIKTSDKLIGSFCIPVEWEIVTIDGWDYLRLINQEDKQGYLAVQYLYGKHFYRGQVLHDERVYNPYFKEYIEIKGEGLSYYSHQANYYLSTFQKDDIFYEWYEIGFVGDSYYQYNFVFIESSVEKELINKITKSYDSL